MENLLELIEPLKNNEIPTSNEIKIYKNSLHSYKKTHFIMIKYEGNKYILVVGKDTLFNDLNGELIRNDAKLCNLSHENRLVINDYFEFTKPQAFGRNKTTIGLGDRLGLATPGHVMAINKTDAKPIFAQQSIRELDLTYRTMEDVIDKAAYGAIQEGYDGGYGADGDHLKKEKDIEHELKLGISMLTLDCSDYISNDINLDDESDIESSYNQLNEETREYYENKYLGKTFKVKEVSLDFSKSDLMKVVAVYSKAIDYMVYIYKTYIKTLDRDIDFEISIDETKTITSPFDHFFVAEELYDQGIKVTSLAPRFCGEFQKGIDYIGDINQFEEDLKIHALIAEHFQYKLSIHSGSDKFSVFPLISEKTKGLFHLKTAGTNWLEAIRLISIYKPDLYKELHEYAFEYFTETQKYYHITPDINHIIPIKNLEKSEYKKYLEDDNARQVLHVSYGLLLTAKNEKNEYLFKKDIYEVLGEYEDEYYQLLNEHICHHLDLLNIISK
ncbi:tagaturonate epimerase family protein [Mammaliicoccus sp. H-M34]|uniref:tagaturonate epimerase family protein n=1 Tax=Mammaliicoccus sp. H-M34 TaxID=2898693 RepID=UPI001EFA8158|nr:tagaturonate epimerase family protein [Mammaliicoccus sp. H-M34]